MRLLPRQEKFFAEFLHQVQIIEQAARLLLDGVKAGNAQLAETAAEIKRCEHRADEIIHDIFTRLNQTFITPLDPEDIHSIASSLDDVIDGIEDAVHRIYAYRIEPIPLAVVRLCEIIYACSKSLGQAFHALDKDELFLDQCIEINRLENEADQLVRKAVTDLFTEEKDCIQLIKLKEVYEFLEQTVDNCEDVADVLQNVVVKNS
jgi:predicted phosphate transport protein (TIGR00153 family)